MNQARFSALIELFLTEKFPEFTETLEYKTNDSFDCDLRSPTNEFSIWIDTNDSEITIGIEDPSGETEIHTHICFMDEEDIEDDLMDLSNTINEIREGKTIIYHSDAAGYHWTNDINLILEKKNSVEKIRVYSWEVG